MSSWWDDFTGVFKQGLSGKNLGTMLGTGIAGYAINKSGLSSPNVPVVGYQGTVPEYTAVRERVPMQQDPNRRPGSGGRRYFSDMMYADRPERQPMTVAQARAKAQEQAQGIAALQAPRLDEKPMMATGGIIGMNTGYYLGGITDGMADKVPARIDNGQEARLSDGEFVIPADVVSHLGNGNSEAGAKQLYEMMSRTRKTRTGNPKQGKEINPRKMLPA
jgi:hypothetical protein|tara:strand:- start:1154 stop:1810 length:657 start_codon:yes stop_codon:yes gene_type:complete